MAHRADLRTRVFTSLARCAAARSRDAPRAYSRVRRSGVVLRAVANRVPPPIQTHAHLRVCARSLTPHSTSVSPKAQLAPKFVRESRHESSEMMMPQHANNLGHVFGGVILSLLDRVAAVA